MLATNIETMLTQSSNSGDENRRNITTWDSAVQSDS